MPAEATSAAETTGPHSCTSPREGPGDGPSSTAPHANARHGLTQPLPIPGPLRDAARPTQPLEPILFPKLRIRFADFPYLHCSTTRGCSPWRPAADIGTVRQENHTVSLGFQGPTKVHRTPREARCFTGTTTLSPAKPIPGCPSLTKKENSSRDFRRRLLVRLRYRTGPRKAYLLARVREY